MKSIIKIIFFVLLEVLHVSTFKGFCDYYRRDFKLKRLERYDEFNTDVNLFCTFNCHLPKSGCKIPSPCHKYYVFSHPERTDILLILEEYRRTYDEEKTEINKENTDCALMISISNWQDDSNFTVVGIKNNTDKFELAVEPYTGTHYEFPTFIIYIVTKENKPLDYNEEDYTFFIEAGNLTTGELSIVYVRINVCQPPIWTYFPSVLKIDDPYNIWTVPIFFNVTATPGRGCENKSIKYFANNTAGRVGMVEVDQNAGNGTILGITPFNTSFNYFSFDVLAYYIPHYSGERKGHVMVLFDDVDDYSPKMDPNGVIKFNVTENGTTTYPINVNDIDLGYNSAFEVLLNVSEEIRDAVEINPTRGGGNTTLELKIDSDKINADVNYTFNITIKVQSVKTPGNGDSLLMEVTFPNKNSANRFGSIIWKTILILCMFSFGCK